MYQIRQTQVRTRRHRGRQHMNQNQVVVYHGRHPSGTVQGKPSESDEGDR